MTKQTTLPIAAMALLVLISPSETRADGFAQFTTINPVTGSATGQLLGTNFVVAASIGQAFFPGGGETNGTATNFDMAIFTPALPLGDVLDLRPAFNAHITFSQPVHDLTLHIFQLADNTLAFTTNGNPAPFTILSSDGNLIPGSGHTSITGTPGNTNASGSLLFIGSLSDLAWVSSGANVPDEILIQLSSPASTTPAPELSIRISQVQLCWYALSNRTYQLQYESTLITNLWTDLGSAVQGTGATICAQDTVSSEQPRRFYRVILLP